MTTDDGDPLQEILSAARDDLSAFATLACVGDAPQALQVLFDRFDRRLRVAAEVRRRELAGRAGR